tara:strand:+ start:25 stop:267 length:243 start_codon:yes stop_codon:yes gene_type:complete
MKGTVTISLGDFEKLKKSQEETNQLKSKTAYTLKEMQVFLSFLCTRSNIEPHVEEFNKQAKSSKIVLSGGRAVIQKVDED